MISGLLPEDLPVTSLSFAFGGLLTPGTTGLTGQGIGGSVLNSLGIGVLGLPIEGQAVGPLGALTNLSQMVAKAIGWDGTGNPLTDLTLPTIDPPAAPEPEPVNQPEGESVNALTAKAIESTNPEDEKETSTDSLVTEATEATEGQQTAEEAEEAETGVSTEPAEQKNEQVTKPTLRKNPLNRLRNTLRAHHSQVNDTSSALGAAVTATEETSTTEKAEESEEAKAPAAEQKNHKTPSKSKTSDRRSAKKRHHSDD